jgi:hypothetical protein
MEGLFAFRVHKNKEIHMLTSDRIEPRDMGETEKMDRALEWVGKAIAAGIDPMLLHYPPGHSQAGYWFCQKRPDNRALDPGHAPEDIHAEIDEILYETGRAFEYRDGMFYRRAGTG